jgi:hypothetical protein
LPFHSGVFVAAKAGNMKRRMTAKPRKARMRKAKSSARRLGVKKSVRAKGNATRAMQTPPDVMDGLVASSAQALGLPIDPAWHDGIKFNLQLILRLAALVDEFPLPDDTEPAPVFHA